VTTVTPYSVWFLGYFCLHTGREMDLECFTHRFTTIKCQNNSSNYVTLITEMILTS